MTFGLFDAGKKGSGRFRIFDFNGMVSEKLFQGRRAGRLQVLLLLTWQRVKSTGGQGRAIYLPDYRMIILGITAFIHNASAALVVDGEIVAAADEERFTREKFTGAFPRRAIEYCLERGGSRLREVDWMAFYWDPWRRVGRRGLMMARSLPHSLAFFSKNGENEAAPRGDFRSWWRMVNVAEALRRAFPGEEGRWGRRYVEHHLAHAASAYYCSPWEEALVLSLDGTGEWTTTLMARGRGTRIEKLHEVAYPHSLGVLYGAVTQYLGYRIYQDEWKVMGLAALGKPRYAEQVRRLARCCDGEIRLDLSYFNFQYADKREWYGPRFVELFGPPPRPEEEAIDSERCADLAASFQLVAEEMGLGLVRHLVRIGGGCRRLCMAGGVALNAALNGKILAQTEVEELFIQPAAADNGAALGAALHLHHALGGRRSPPLRDVYLGPEYDEARVLEALRGSGLRFEKSGDIAARVGRLLAEGKVVGWFQGRMEYGPRALGNRSILADPRNAEMKGVVNAKVKFREAFRPFAPAILAERVGEYFEMPGAGARFPFMTTVLPVRGEKRGVIPAVTHIDGTGRLQTVEKGVNPRFYAVIEEFERLTGVPVVLNTSFNVAGEPIVCTPEDAIRTFRRSGLDALAMGDYLCTRAVVLTAD
jgi:carbamoyltransferase